MMQSAVAHSPFPFLPMRHGVLFPGTATTVAMGRRQSLALLTVLAPGSVLGVGVQRDPRENNPGIADLWPIGSFARVRQIIRQGPGETRLELEGLSRFHLDNLVASEPFWRAEGRPAMETAAPPDEAARLTAELAETLADAGGLPEALQERLTSWWQFDDPGLFADRVAAALGLSSEKEIQVLAALDVAARLRLVQGFVREAQAVADIRSKIDSDVRHEFSKTQREAILREQLRAIKRELGEGEEQDEGSELRKKIDEVELPAEARTVAERELKRLEAMPTAHPERAMIRNYLELIVSLPWSRRAPSATHLDRVTQQLDDDHYGLAEVKKRILEHLAVLKLAGKAHGTVLCLVGPPGVGKTSLGQSIANAMGRPFVRVALGGVRDEAEIRGHRRTYVGALPGRILHALKSGGVKNPVFLIDEVDKLSQGWGGSPEAALLEVLDPEQNRTFQDHYLELPFDLSEVLFICTANSLETMSAPLRDRLEIIELTGYTLEEKLHIARRHLLPKKLEEHGLAPEALSISEGALKAMIADYTREAGVRQVAREITRLCRAVTLEMARQPDSKAKAYHIEESSLRDYLGKVRFYNEVAERTQISGVATGLAWTPAGGDILFVETSRMRGKGRIEITGQLGDVMKESARAALSYVRSNAQALGVDPEFLETQDLHIHVPAGAVPKDGPSAGVTMFTAITSLLTGKRVRADTAMTGECTLRGRVLPVGGIKEKVLAAHRAGLARVILPKKNERDLDDVPKETRESVEFIFAEDMSEVLRSALEAAPASDLPAPDGSFGRMLENAAH
jgi:ATP-dependent Lon protease